MHEATWSMDASSQRIVSLTLAGNQGSGKPTASLFTAGEWTPRSLTLTAAALLAPP